MEKNLPDLPLDNDFLTMANTVPTLIWIAGPDKQCCFLNTAWYKFTGRTAEQELGTGWTEGIHRDDFANVMTQNYNAFVSRQEFKIEYRLKRYDGQYRWILDTGVPRFNEQGEFTGYIGSCVDIDELLNTNRFQQDYISNDLLRKEQSLNEELAAVNEEMITVNEELAASNEELTSTIEELHIARETLSELNNNLEIKVAERVKDVANRESSLRSLVMTAHYPLMILRGREWIIEIANQPLVNLWDKTIEGVTGHPLMEILPEIENQPFPTYLRQVYDTGVGFGDEEQIFYYNSPTGPAIKYVSYYYDPLLDEGGNVAGIIVAADDITEKVRARQLLEKSYEDQQALNEEFASINEELATTIDELSVANDGLAISEERFRKLIRQAPVSICVIRAEDLLVQEVNDNYLVLVGKSRVDLENRPIWEAVAEAAEYYAPIMQQVINSGVAFVAKEHELMLVRNRVQEVVFIDFVYEPVVNSNGTVLAVMVVGIDVTDKVIARRGIEDVEQRIRLAVEAAEIGTFDLNYVTGTMVSSERFNAIFGFEETVSREVLLSRFHPEDMHLSGDAHRKAAASGKMFYEARLLHHDNSLRWIRVHGDVYYNEGGQPVRLLGTVLDITDFKQLQQQKDDFISIASHELKTPLTTLKASLQLLDRIKDNPASSMLTKLINQSNRSMGKISELVDDLLNVSRMNEGQIKLNKSSFLVSTLLNECCSHVRTEGRHELIFQGDEELTVVADEHRIEQVVVNFVNNATKYAPNSREIYLRAEPEGEMARISVQDKGPGIDTVKLPHLFDRYYRVTNPGDQVSGLGLGLYICADIIHRHGGEIGVDSVIGEGSTFWFTIPCNSI